MAERPVVLPPVTAEQPMSHPQSNRPPCPNCKLEMWLVRLEPIGPSHERRSFECQQCQHAETLIVKFK